MYDLCVCVVVYYTIKEVPVANDELHLLCLLKRVRDINYL